MRPWVMIIGILSLIVGFALMGIVQSDPMQARDYTKGTTGFLASSGAYREIGVGLSIFGLLCLIGLGLLGKIGRD